MLFRKKVCALIVVAGLAFQSAHAQTVGEIMTAIEIANEVDGNLEALAKQHGGDLGCAFYGSRKSACNSKDRCLKTHKMLRDLAAGKEGAAYKVERSYLGRSSMYNKCFAWFTGWPSTRNSTGAQIEKSLLALHEAEKAAAERGSSLESALRRAVGDDQEDNRTIDRFFN